MGNPLNVRGGNGKCGIVRFFAGVPVYPTGLISIMTGTINENTIFPFDAMKEEGEVSERVSIEFEGFLFL